MKYFDWNIHKNEELTSERGAAFEDAVYCITQGGLLDTIEHPNKKKYPDQKIFIPEFCTKCRSEAPKAFYLRRSWSDFDPQSYYPYGEDQNRETSLK